MGRKPTTAGIEPKPHWWETRLVLLPHNNNNNNNKNNNNNNDDDDNDNDNDNDKNVKYDVC